MARAKETFSLPLVTRLTYSDRLGKGIDGRVVNEQPASTSVARMRLPRPVATLAFQRCMRPEKKSAIILGGPPIVTTQARLIPDGLIAFTAVHAHSKQGRNAKGQNCKPGTQR